MNTESPISLEIAGLQVQIIRKTIKNLHVGVYPPEGHVRVAAPPSVSVDAIRRAVLTRLSWIKQKQAGFVRQARETERAFVSGETHFVLGRACRLEVQNSSGRPSIELIASGRLLMRCPHDSSTETKSKLMARWYRRLLVDKAAPRTKRWARKLGVETPAWGIRRMKTKWGSCNVTQKKIWLNLELAKKPLHCLDYVILHETGHLVSPRHDALFVETLDKAMPGWRQVRSDLNAFHLAFEPSFEGGAVSAAASEKAEAPGADQEILADSQH